MANLSQFRFRIVTSTSVGAYTTAHAACQADALASLLGQLTRWETALPLHGPSVSPRWFD
jgi:hypothetical protein